MTSTTVLAAPPLSGLHHLGLTVRDIDASEAWYHTVLGFVRAFVEPYLDGTGYAVVMTRPGAAFFVGLDHHDRADDSPFGAYRTGLDHLAFALSSRAELDDWLTHFHRLGVEHGEVTEAEDPVPMALTVIHDPDGIPIELIWFGTGS